MSPELEEERELLPSRVPLQRNDGGARKLGAEPGGHGSVFFGPTDEPVQHLGGGDVLSSGPTVDPLEGLGMIEDFVLGSDGVLGPSGIREPISNRNPSSDVPPDNEGNPKESSRFTEEDLVQFLDDLLGPRTSATQSQGDPRFTHQQVPPPAPVAHTSSREESPKEAVEAAMQDAIKSFWEERGTRCVRDLIEARAKAIYYGRLADRLGCRSTLVKNLTREQANAKYVAESWAAKTEEYMRSIGRDKLPEQVVDAINRYVETRERAGLFGRPEITDERYRQIMSDAEKRERQRTGGLWFR